MPPTTALTSLPNGTTLTSSHLPTRICVFCGASPGTSPAHMSAARTLAQTMAAHNISLVYGGGTVGLMGELARTLVSLSGPESVHGIIPSALIKYERENASTTGKEGEKGGEKVEDEGREKERKYYETFGKTTIVKDMHTRKQIMARQVIEGGPGSGFIALTGGFGTLEELMEVVTWNQLGIHDRGVCVFNVEGYWDGILEWVRGAVGAGFVREKSGGIIGEGRGAEECVQFLREWRGQKGLGLDWESS